jgi:hypothetical protein
MLPDRQPRIRIIIWMIVIGVAALAVVDLYVVVAGMLGV